jgi:hypothetical protein
MMANSPQQIGLAWLELFGYAVLPSPDIAVGEPTAERSDPNYCSVVSSYRLSRDDRNEP